MVLSTIVTWAFQLEDYNRFVHAEAKGLFRSIVTEGNQHEVNPTLGSWLFNQPPPNVPSPRNKVLIRPYFWGGGTLGGGWLTSHDWCVPSMDPNDFCLFSRWFLTNSTMGFITNKSHHLGEYFSIFQFGVCLKWIPGDYS